MDIELEVAKIDYLTLTTFNRGIAQKWMDWIEVFSGRERENLDSERRHRYVGMRGFGDMASVFLGERGDGKHYMLQISGQDSDELIHNIPDMMSDVMSQRVRCTRIDVQVTIVQPPGWSQLDYKLSAEEAGLKPTNARSDNKEHGVELETVYTGKKTSGRLNRLYQKVTDDGVLLLRYETQYTEDYATSVIESILNNGVKPESIIRGEIARRGIGMLDNFDLWADGLFAPKRRRKVIEADKRAAWLVDDILPVLMEYIERHDADPRVLDTYIDALTEYTVA
jgi:hypothetical protein